jgi:predicted DNA-binding protein
MDITKRGGIREGAGRKAIGITKKVSITLNEETWEKLEQTKHDENISQSSILRSIIENHYRPVEKIDQQRETKEKVRAELWLELIKMNIFESYVDIKESDIKECIKHWKYPNELKVEVWQRCKDNSKEQGYKKFGVKYLLGAFLFEGNRLLLDKNFESLKEQIIFSIIRYVWLNEKDN